MAKLFRRQLRLRGQFRTTTLPAGLGCPVLSGAAGTPGADLGSEARQLVIADPIALKCVI